MERRLPNPVGNPIGLLDRVRRRRGRPGSDGAVTAVRGAQARDDQPDDAVQHHG